MPRRTRGLIVSTTTALLVAIVIYGILAPAPEDRLRGLGDTIRCPVCEAESIGQSQTEIARDMMDLTEEMIAAGRTDKEILAFFRSTYGEYIILDPPITGLGLLLVALPAAAAIGVVALALSRRRRDLPR